MFHYRGMPYPPKFWECPGDGCPWSGPPAGDSQAERQTATNKLFKHLQASQGCLGSAGYPDLMSFKQVNWYVYLASQHFNCLRRDIGR